MINESIRICIAPYWLLIHRNANVIILNHYDHYNHYNQWIIVHHHDVDHHFNQLFCFIRTLIHCCYKFSITNDDRIDLFIQFCWNCWTSEQWWTPMLLIWLSFGKLWAMNICHGETYGQCQGFSSSVLMNGFIIIISSSWWQSA